MARLGMVCIFASRSNAFRVASKRLTRGRASCWCRARRIHNRPGDEILPDGVRVRSACGKIISSRGNTGAALSILSSFPNSDTDAGDVVLGDEDDSGLFKDLSDHLQVLFRSGRHVVRPLHLLNSGPAQPRRLRQVIDLPPQCGSGHPDLPTCNHCRAGLTAVAGSSPVMYGGNRRVLARPRLRDAHESHEPLSAHWPFWPPCSASTKAGIFGGRAMLAGSLRPWGGRRRTHRSQGSRPKEPQKPLQTSTRL